jgi:hypothetical protein
LELNSKLAVVSVVVAGGAEVIVVIGATVSTVHVYDASLVFPAPSVARTVNVCEPSPSPV